MTEQEYTVTVAKDCARASIEISLWYFLKTETSTFNLHEFYSKILLPPGEEATSENIEYCTANGSWDGFDYTNYMLRKRRYKKRAVERTFLSLGMAT